MVSMKGFCFQPFPGSSVYRPLFFPGNLIAMGSLVSVVESLVSTGVLCFQLFPGSSVVTGVLQIADQTILFLCY